MAFSEYLTELSVDRFFQIIGIQPFHANQLRTPAGLDPAGTHGCSSVIYQHRWQSPGGVPGRNDIAAEIHKAEQDMELFLHFKMLKGWVTDEVMPSYGHERFVHGYPVKMQHAHLGCPAVQVVDEIALDVDVAPNDYDGDNYNEQAVLTFTLDQDVYDTVESAEEFRVFYPGRGGDPHWEIRPVEASIDPDTLLLTITLSMSQIVKPNLVEQMVPGPLNSDDPTTFLDKLDIYRVHSDYASDDIFKIVCSACTSSPTRASTSGFHISIEDRIGGIFRIDRPFGIGGSSCTCWRPKETLSYTAGYLGTETNAGSTFTKMAPKFEKAIAALVMSRLGGICSCHMTIDYTRDLSIITQASSSGGDTSHTRWATKPPDDVMKNPFGTSLGENIAWTTIVDEIVGETGNDYIDVSASRGPHRPWQSVSGGRPLW